MIKIARREDDVIDWMMMFPKYRRLKARLKTVNKDNRNLRKNWEQQVIINDNLKEKRKKDKELIYQLRKEIRENEVNKRYENCE